MPRPLSKVWDHFVVLVPKGEKKCHPDVSCKYCGHNLRNAQTRSMIPHLIKCPKVDSNTKQIWVLHEQTKNIYKINNYQKQTPSSDLTKNRTPSPNITRRLFVTPHNQRRSNSKTSSRSKNKRNVKISSHDLGLRITRYIVATGTPFRVVDDKHFRNMFEEDRILPTRRQVSGNLLDEVYNIEREEVISVLKDVTKLSIITDGWTNRNNQSVINYVLFSPFLKPIFWKSYTTGEDAHTSQYICDKILEVVSEVNSIVGRNVVCAVVTDNAANMQGAWRLIESLCPTIVCNGCAAHVLNLLMKDIFQVDMFQRVLDASKTVTNFINRRHALVERFRSLQKSMKSSSETKRALALPVATRWYSSERCIRGIVENRNVIAATFSDEILMQRYHRSNELSAAKEIVNDSLFWKDAKVVLRLIHPIDKALALFEMDNTSISSVVHVFNALDRFFNQTVFPSEVGLMISVRAKVNSRKTFLLTSSMKAAYLLDPTKQIPNEAMDFIKDTVSLAERIGFPENVTQQLFHNELVQFARDKQSWTDNVREEHGKYNPLDWWSFTPKYRLLKYIAVHILSIPTSSAASERSWSIHSFIQTQRRNRLSSERLSKLVFVYSNIGDKNAADHVLCEVYPEAAQLIEFPSGEYLDFDQMEDPNYQDNCYSTPICSKRSDVYSNYMRNELSPIPNFNIATPVHYQDATRNPSILNQVPIQTATLNEAPIQSKSLIEASTHCETLNETPIQSKSLNEASTQCETLNETPIQNASLNETPIQNASLNETPNQNASLNETPIQQ